MDCCGSNKPKENQKDVTTEKTENEKNLAQTDEKISPQNHKTDPVGKEQTHGGGCCGGGGGRDMWLHLIIMLIVFAAVWFFTKR